MQSRWFYLFVFVIAQTIAYILDWMIIHKKDYKLPYLISLLVSIGLFIYAFYRKANINVTDKPLQDVDNILLGTVVLSVITVCLWRYISKPFIQFLVVLNVLVSTISMNYMYANNILSTVYGQSQISTEKLHERAMIIKKKLLQFATYKKMIKTFIVFLIHIANITHRCYKDIMA